MKVKYYYSACVGITTPDISILCDPWFTDGIYDGSWYQFPKFEDPLGRIEKYDLIYISHIHPDHYDPIFLREYLNKYPDTKIIAKEKFLINAIKREGFKLFKGDQVGETEFKVFFNDTSSVSDIDTALVVKWRDKSVVNMNDNMPNETQLRDIKDFAPNPSVAFIGYSGAGPYPQTYYTDHDILMLLAEEKKQKMFGRYKELDKALNAEINIPFAGQYLLGGNLSGLNRYRGVPDATEVLAIDPKAVPMEECAELLLPYGPEEIMDVIRTEPYKGIEKYIKKITNNRMDYENIHIPLTKIPFERLLKKAYERAMKANEYKGNNYYIAIKLTNGYYVCNINSYAEKSYLTDEIPSEPYSIIDIDLRCLFGLLTGIYHWNNAEVGSHFKTIRKPDVFNRDAQRFLNFFYI